MIEQLFSIPVWKDSCNMDEIVSEELYNQIVKDYTDNPNQKNPDWRCDVHSTFASNTVDTVNYYNACLYYKQAYENFVNFLELNLAEHTYNISKVWYNKYHQNQYQEQHHHLPSTFSGVHYLKLKEGHNYTTFFNPSKYEYVYEDYARELYEISDSNDKLHSFVFRRWSVPVQEGDIIIFPSSLEHAVWPQNTDDERITVSFNIDVHRRLM